MRQARIAVGVATLAGWLVQAPPYATAQSATHVTAQQARVVAHSAAISRRGASLEFELANGETLQVSLVGGEVSVEHVAAGERTRKAVGAYSRGSDLEIAWQTLVADAGRADPAQMLAAVQGWEVPGLTAENERIRLTIVRTFSQMAAAPVASPVGPAPTFPTERRAVPASAAASRVSRTTDLDYQRPSAARSRSAIPPTRAPTGNRSVQPSPPLSAGSVIGRMAGDVASLLSAFVALSALGFGLVFFAPRQLEVVADTVRRSFWRCFLTGLVAQPLIVPLFATLVIGLALTVVGLLVVPFAVIALLAVTVLAVVGGFLAVARSVGEIYLRRKMARGKPVGSWLPYRYVVVGLIALLALWIPVVLFGWIPIAGEIASIGAILLTWTLATAGLGATLLSHAGIRGTFARQLDQALTDELFYHTPNATPVVSTRVRPRPSEPS